MPPTIPARGYAATSRQAPLAPFDFARRTPGPRDVRLGILFCGVCHSELHQARNEWAGTTYPVVPGHEIVGRVAEVGAEVTRFRPGDLAAVGCMVDACRTCPECRMGLEQLCQGTITFTYNSPDPVLGGMTYGGYSDQVVVDQDFVLRVPSGLDPARAAPLLCAGITTWSPLRHWRVGPGQRVGVVGLGGLGHMAVQLAHALGAEVTLFTTSAAKAADARRFGADAVVLSSDPVALRAHAGRLDFTLDTVAAPHDLDPYLRLLKRDGTHCLVGLPETPHPAPSPFGLIGRRRRLAGSMIGGIAETQELLEFCAAQGIASEIELIPMREINAAYERMLRSDVKYRFVLDLATLER